MAEAHDTTPAAEPSMEEILASIRRIISDDEPVVANGAGSDDIIELTQAVQDDGTVVDLNEQASPPPPPPVPEPVAVAPEPVKPAPVEKMSEPVETLVSEPKIDVAASALSSLASTVEIERLASEPRTATYLGNGYRTLEDMAVELMRPMLKQWLDDNLPATVERLVQKEIERISKRAKD